MLILKIIYLSLSSLTHPHDVQTHVFLPFFLKISLSSHPHLNRYKRFTSSGLQAIAESLKTFKFLNDVKIDIVW